MNEAERRNSFERQSFEDEEKEASASPPVFPRKEDGCIDPCPHFECMLGRDICDSNCHRCLDNPCLMCENNYEGECSKSEEPNKLKATLLRPDVISFINSKQYNRMGFVTKDQAQNLRIVYAEELNKIEEEEHKLVRSIKESWVPNFILKAMKSKKLNSIKEEKARLEGKVMGQNDLFNK